MKSNSDESFKPLLLFALLASGTSALAHDVILNGQVGEAMITSQILIQHSCDSTTLDANGNPIFPKIIAQSVILPTVSPVSTREDGGEIPDLNGDGIHDVYDVAINYGPSLMVPYWDNRIFKDHQLKHDSLGNIIGFSSTGGSFPQGFMGEVPIRITPVFFWDGEGPNGEVNCANKLVVQPVGADICAISQVPVNGEVNIWMDHPTAKFPNFVHGVGENAMRLEFNRLAPLPDACNGVGYTVKVTASDEDIDANLPIPGYWPADPKAEHKGHKQKPVK